MAGRAALEGLDPGAGGGGPPPPPAPAPAPGPGPAPAPAPAPRGPGGGWRYAVAVPGWEVREPAAASGDSGVVVFRVDVRVRAPPASPPAGVDGGEAGGAGAPRAPAAGPAVAHTVLRRFSDFRRLHTVLEGLFPAEMEARPPPPKRAMLGGRARDEALERRRAQLEAWLRSLTALGAVAGSEPMLQFLQLDALAQDAQHLSGEPDPGWVSLQRTPSPVAAQRTPPPRRRSPPRAGPSGGGFSFLGPSPKYREALGVLQGAAEVSASERRHALDCLAAETAAKELLARRVDELEREAVGFAGQLERARAEGGAAANERLAALEYEVAELRRRSSGAEAEVSRAAAATAAAETRCAEAEAATNGLRMELGAAAEGARVAEARLDALRAEAQKDIATMAAEVRRQKQATADLERRLAEQAAQAGEKADAERERAEWGACEAMLSEAAAVRQRLQDCSLERLGEEEKAGRGAGAGAGPGPGAEARSLALQSQAVGASAEAALTEQLLDLSDSRLGFLIAEAQVLAEPPRGAGACGRGWARAEAAIRKTLGHFLVDQAQTRKVSNALLRAQLPARRLDGSGLAGEGAPARGA